VVHQVVKSQCQILFETSIFGNPGFISREGVESKQFTRFSSWPLRWYCRHATHRACHDTTQEMSETSI